MSHRYGYDTDPGEIEADCAENSPNYAQAADIDLGQCTTSTFDNRSSLTGICPTSFTDGRYWKYTHEHFNSNKTELRPDVLAEGKTTLNRCDSSKCDSGICLSSFDNDSGISSFCSGKASENTHLSGLEPLVESVQSLNLSDHEDKHVNTGCFTHIGDSRTAGVTKNEQSGSDKPEYPDSSVYEEGYSSFPEQNLSLPRSTQYLEIFSQDEDGDTQLHTAIVVERPDAALCMIQQYTTSPYYLDMFNNLKQTALHLAVLTDQWEVVRHLVAYGAQIDLRDRNGNTALHLACKQGRLNCVWALTHPIQPQEQQAVPYLVPKHCIPQDSKLQSYDGDTCLHLAARQKYMDILTYLIQCCHSDINAAEGKSGRTILHEATESNDLEMVTFLIQQPGINLNALTYDLCTPYQLAIGRGHRTVADCLTRAGANTALRDIEDQEDDDIDDESQSDGSMAYDDILIGGQRYA